MVHMSNRPQLQRKYFVPHHTSEPQPGCKVWRLRQHYNFRQELSGMKCFLGISSLSLLQNILWGKKISFFMSRLGRLLFLKTTPIWAWMGTSAAILIIVVGPGKDSYPRENIGYKLVNIYLYLCTFAPLYTPALSGESTKTFLTKCNRQKIQ